MTTIVNYISTTYFLSPEQIRAEQIRAAAQIKAENQLRRNLGLTKENVKVLKRLNLTLEQFDDAQKYLQAGMKASKMVSSSKAISLGFKKDFVATSINLVANDRFQVFFRPENNPTAIPTPDETIYWDHNIRFWSDDYKKYQSELNKQKEKQMSQTQQKENAAACAPPTSATAAPANTAAATAAPPSTASAKK